MTASGAARGESNAFGLSRVVTEVDEVKEGAGWLWQNLLLLLEKKRGGSERICSVFLNPFP